MRSVAAAATMAAALTCSLMGSVAHAQASAAKHRATTTGAGAQRRTAATASTTPEEGLAAAGTMPSVTGPVKTLYAMRYVDLKTGTGELAQTQKFYTVHYTGWTTDGKKFDSSFDHGGQEPIVFPVGAHKVIIGWDTGFQGMRVGGKRRLIVPYQLAYGEPGRPPVIPEKADLIFDVELLAQGDTPPQQPAAPSGNPAGAGGAAQQQKPAQQPGTNPVTGPASNPAAKPE